MVARHSGGAVVDRDLAGTELPFVNAPWLAAYFTPSGQHSPEMKETLRVSDELVAEILKRQAAKFVSVRR